MQRNLRLVACLLNISEASDSSIVNSVVRAATEGQDKWKPVNASNDLFKCHSTVLNVFSDLDYNRSVITIAAPVETISYSVFQAFRAAYDLIDIRRHIGVHPRLGSVDLVPLHPLSSSVTLDECGVIAREIGSRITEHFSEACLFYFGGADSGKKRGLVVRRKEMNWYTSGTKKIQQMTNKYDVGNCPSIKNGVTGIGAIPYMMNLNVTLKTNNIEIGASIARAIRASTPMNGLAGVQAMAFPHEGNVEIACNLDTDDISKKKDIYFTTPKTLEETIKHRAAEMGIEVLHNTLIGFTPDEAYDKAYDALTNNVTCMLSINEDQRM